MLASSREDLESGLPPPSRPAAVRWRSTEGAPLQGSPGRAQRLGLGGGQVHLPQGFDGQRLLAVLLLFLLLTGVMPVSYLALALFGVLCLATCLRALAMHQIANQIQGPTGGEGQRGALQGLSRAASLLLLSGRPVDLLNLRLSLLDRNFNESDYEALLLLDANAPRPVQPVTESHLAHLPQHLHAPKPGLELQHPADESAGPICSVCLDAFAAGARVRSLPCSHQFHGDCIEPWLLQQGLGATCPICKCSVFAPPQP